MQILVACSSLLSAAFVLSYNGTISQNHDNMKKLQKQYESSHLKSIFLQLFYFPNATDLAGVFLFVFSDRPFFLHVSINKKSQEREPRQFTRLSLTSINIMHHEIPARTRKVEIDSRMKKKS